MQWIYGNVCSDFHMISLVSPVFVVLLQSDIRIEHDNVWNNREINYVNSAE